MLAGVGLKQEDATRLQHGRCLVQEPQDEFIPTLAGVEGQAGLVRKLWAGIGPALVHIGQVC